MPRYYSSDSYGLVLIEIEETVMNEPNGKETSRLAGLLRVPATLLILSIKGFPVPLPWILAPIICLALWPLCWVVSKGLKPEEHPYQPLLANWHLVIAGTIDLRGLEIRIHNSEVDLGLRFW